MQINQINAFLAVAELESFSLAAESLHITQPAVSKRIRQLENTLRVELFDRIGKRSILTPNGQAFRPHAERILQELQAYRSSLSRQQRVPSGSLSFATSHHIGLHRLPQVLRDFKIRYSQVDLDLHFMDSEDACVAIANNELELAIVTLPEMSDDKLDCEAIWIDDLVVVMAADHELAGHAEIDPAQLLAYAAVLPSAGTFTRKIINNLFDSSREMLNIILETNYLETIKVMVSANLGWSILPQSMVDPSLTSHRLRGLDVFRPLGIVTRKNRTLSLSSSAMIELLRDNRDSNMNKGARQTTGITG
ncbi:MAG: LysR family transcriptional regulator [Gammaproteobacteria bacterium]|nr:MAG: LysR family transcriptional regulator [Gammaproteobacteria bacterium]UCH41715.1 MAG: LysR family transcriptional regulator [Gammaproteobacteria bacterium]